MAFEINKKDFLVISFVHFWLLPMYWLYGFSNNFVFAFTNYLIILISIIGLFYKSYWYFSIRKIFFLFNLLFFGLIPYFDNIFNKYYWGGAEIDIFFFNMSNIIIIISTVVYILIYSVFKPKLDIAHLVNKENKIQSFFKNNNKKAILTLFGIAILSMVLIFYYRDWTFVNLFFRDLYPNSYSRINYVFVAFFITPIPIISLVILRYILNIKPIISIKYRVIILIFGFLAILFVFPTSVPRFLALALYLPLIISYTDILNKKYRIEFYSIFGLFFIMPFLDKFRYFSTYENSQFNYNLSFLQAGHFDAYQNFVRLVSIDYVSYGEQLMGVLIFFIPSSWMEGKPTGTGVLIGKLSNLDLQNIGMPLIAEGYANFSILGSIVFIGLFAFLSKYFDSKYWTLRRYYDQHSFFTTYYLLLGLTIYILRGALMSSAAYSISILSISLLIFFMLRKMVSMKIV